MRLTLRTLLAYLDDTLEPAEIKRIGQKVTESDAAQETIARIKQVTRKRRLTTPPATGPGSFDPNTVAEYLDNELAPEAVSEVEKLALESDVHLAEIAACHQILTLVLGEPALVPPTAKERMYKLVHGRESVSRRVAKPRAVGIGAAEQPDTDDAFLTGLPSLSGGTGPLRWALPAAGLLLAAGLCIALFFAIPRGTGTPVVLGPRPPKPDNGQPADPNKDAPKDNSKDAKKDGPTDGPKDSGKPKDDGGKGPPDKPVVPPDPDPVVKPLERPAKPDLQTRQAAGTYRSEAGGPPTILVRRANAKDPWQRLKPGANISTLDELVSLPGYTSELRLPSGVRLTLWGAIPPLPSPFLAESAVTLHHNPKLDAELTLERGRIYLANPDEARTARTRVRFEREIWDLDLGPASEVALELFRLYTPELSHGGEDPYTEVRLYVTKGEASLQTGKFLKEMKLRGPTGPAFFAWDNKRAPASEPLHLDQSRAEYAKNFPNDLPRESELPKEFRELLAGRQAALAELSTRLVDGKKIEIVLEEDATQADKPARRELGIWSLGAIDAASDLLRILDDEDPQRGDNRQRAILALQRWMSQSSGQSARLYDPKAKTGILVTERKYRLNEAGILLELLQGYTLENLKDKETWVQLAGYLDHPKMSIREAGYFNLAAMSGGVQLPPYNPAGGADLRKAAKEGVLKLVQDGKLPPPPPKPMPSGGGTGSR